MNLLKQSLIKRGYTNIEEIIYKFNIYCSLLIQENKKYNLTAITKKEQIEVKHFIDSIQAENLIEGKIIDIGTGAGFPSIPLAILKRDCFFTLIDSTKKKTDFLELVKKELCLNNIEIKHKRIEELDKKIKYDYAVSRAVAPLNILCEYSLPFIRVGQKLIAYKGNNYKDEINSSTNALKVLGAKVEKIHTYSIDVYERNIIEIKKIKECPDVYPRGGNKARIKPL